jgi:hypothetical protein
MHWWNSWRQESEKVHHTSDGMLITQSSTQNSTVIITLISETDSGPGDHSGDLAWTDIRRWSCYENLKGFGKIRPWPILRYYLGLEEMRKTTINISQDNQCLNRSVNRDPPENKHTDRLRHVARYKNLCKRLLQKKCGGLEFLRRRNLKRFCEKV